MNILRHMEAVFVATVVITVGGAYAMDTLPQAHAKAAVVASAVVQAPVVVVTAKRMSAEEKRQSLQDERAAGNTVAAVPAPAHRM